MKRSLVVLLIIAILFICLQLILRAGAHMHPLLNQLISIVYLWSPGFVALFFAKREGIMLPVFARPNKTFYLIPIYALLIGVFSFLLFLLFGGEATPNQAFAGQSIMGTVGYIILFFFSAFVLAAVIFSFVFWGGELYWRGYLWEQLKSRGPLKAIWMIALIWSVWQIPLTLLSYTPGLESVIYNFLLIALLFFAFSPVLTFIRLKCRSILASAIFYGAATSAVSFFIVLFPTTRIHDLVLYGLSMVLSLVLFSVVFKLYSPSTWVKLK